MKHIMTCPILAAIISLPALAQQDAGFAAGTPLGTLNEAGVATAMSDNVTVYGSFRSAESCVFDPARNLILAINNGVPQDLQENDGYVSLIKPDGSVHTSKWIGATRNGLTLNQPLGSALLGQILYIVDINYVRLFDLATGHPIRSIEVPEATGLNGVAVAADGTVYASNTGGMQRVYKITPAGEVSVFVDGSPLSAPNGVAIDGDGNIVVVNIGDNAVLTFNHQGELLMTERAAEGGNDGLVILEDGNKYVSSVRYGSVSRIRPGEEAEVIAVGIPAAASMCYDSRQHQLVIPMNQNNALAFIKLEK